MREAGDMDHIELFNTMCALWYQERENLQNGIVSGTPSWGDFDEMDTLMSSWNDTGICDSHLWEVVREYQEYDSLTVYCEFETYEELGKGDVEGSGDCADWMYQYIDFDDLGRDRAEDNERYYVCNDDTIVEVSV